MRALMVFVGCLTVIAPGWPDQRLEASQGVAPADCVTIGKPRPSATYTYEHLTAAGTRTQYTSRWESVTEAGSRVTTTRPNGTLVQTNEHHLADDVVLLDRSSQQSAGGGAPEVTSFNPGLVSDPAFRACAGRSWTIPSVTATFRTGGRTVSAKTPPGTLRIVALRESVTVPAGKFDTVHYIRTSQSTDEYWKSLEHGVVVKQISRLPNETITMTLISIK